MITITSARICQGYTGCDHLISQSDCDTVANFVGRRFGSRAAALRAVNRAYSRGCDRRVRTARVEIDVRLADGSNVYNIG